MIILDEMDSLEFWIGLDHYPNNLYKSKSFKSGPILVSATGSMNLPTIIRRSGYTGAICATSKDSEKAFKSLETDMYKNVSVGSLLEAAKEIKNPLSILSAEYEGNHDLNKVIQEIVDIGVLHMREEGVISLVVDYPKEMPVFYRDSINTFNQQIETAKNHALKNDMMEAIKYFLMTIGHLKAPGIKIDYDSIDEAIDIERKVWNNLFNQIRTIDEAIKSVFSFSYTFAGHVLQEFLKRGRAFRMMGTIGVRCEDVNKVRIYGSVARPKKRTNQAIFELLRTGPEFPHFAFYDKLPIREFVYGNAYDQDPTKILAVSALAHHMVSEKFLDMGTVHESIGHIKLSE